ncbi:hypothetical protein [Geobacillus subterraneus]|uniref:Uncharacterized protein n=1 Tax=Geobacillus subterraneus TaxID=129338 RepID=A0A679FS35_9BACL|nr:hypothetical protein [Geobacillus subterraneus]BBW98963.1 hypothetical protein GsuE55_37960 [Geobacillus subterraneus]
MESKGRIHLYNFSTLVLMHAIGFVLFLTVSLEAKLIDFLLQPFAGMTGRERMEGVVVLLSMGASFWVCRYVFLAVKEEIRYLLTGEGISFKTYKGRKEAFYGYLISCLLTGQVWLALWCAGKYEWLRFVVYMVISPLLGWFLIKTILDVWVEVSSRPESK